MKTNHLFLALIVFVVGSGTLKADFTVINESQFTIKVKRGADREQDLRKGKSQVFASAKASDSVSIRGSQQLKATVKVPKGQKLTEIRRGLKWEIKIGR